MLSSIRNNILLFILIVVAFNLNAQNYPSKNISTADGLSNNQVETILKDSRGILWIGTNNGLSKIENDVIENFFVENGLAHNSAWDIIEDRNGNIWIGSYGGGVTKFDGQQFTIYNKEKGVVNNFVRKLYEYKNYVFVGTKNGLSIINLNNDKVETIKTEIDDFQVMDFFVYKDAIYCGTFKKGIFKIDIINKSVKKIFNYQNGWDDLFSVYLKDSLFYYSIDGANSNIHKGTLKKFKIDSLLNNKKEDLIFGKSIIWNYATDSDNILYGSAWGVYTNDGGVYQIQNDTFIDRSKDFGITTPNVRSLYFDQEFNFLYIGTIDKGVFQVDLNRKINYFKNEELDIVDIEYTQSNLALLNTKGLTIINNNKIIRQVSKREFYKLNKIAHVISPQEIVFYKILKHSSSFWISSNIGMFHLSLDGDILKHYQITAINIKFDYKGNLLAPNPYSSFYIYTNLKEYQHQNFDALDANTPVNITGYSKLNDKIFISTAYRGLFLYDNEKFISLKETNAFKELELNHLAQFKETDTLVISTSSGDIYLADTTEDFRILKKIKREDIIGNSILFLETYKDYMLIGTNEGLNIYSDGTLQFIDEEQGLNDVEFTSSKVMDGKLIIGTHKGYYVLDLTKTLNPSPVNLDLKIAELSINHQSENSDKYKWFNYKTNDLNLKYNQNQIAVNFKLSTHPYPKKLSYSYKVKGLDSTWSDYTSKTNIDLPYLPSGNFDISVKIKDLNTGTVTLSKLMSLVITPPFWETWWFILITLLTLIIIGVVASKKRVSYIKKSEQQKAMIQKRIVETKMEALQSQMNPHFTFNAMNSIQNYIIDNDIDNALMYLGEFAKLIRITLDNSSKPLITLAEEISYLKSYVALENMRFNNKVDVSMNYDELEISDIELPPMLIQPFVENTFVHAFEKNHKSPKLTLKFSIKNNTLYCEVKDNGKGMSKTTSGQLHQSQGLKLVSERLNLLNKSSNNSLEISSEIEKGTVVTLKFELIKSNE